MFYWLGLLKKTAFILSSRAGLYRLLVYVIVLLEKQKSYRVSIFRRYTACLYTLHYTPVYNELYAHDAMSHPKADCILIHYSSTAVPKCQYVHLQTLPEKNFSINPGCLYKVQLKFRKCPWIQEHLNRY